MSAIEIDIRGPVAGEDRRWVSEFLRAEGYRGGIGAGDRVFAAWQGTEVVGAVRLAVEDGVTVLRGMRVRLEVQHRGIGTRLLNRVGGALGERPCYCLPYAWLTQFYGTIGFEPVDADSVPRFLSARHAAYRAQGLNVVLMARRVEATCPAAIRSE